MPWTCPKCGRAFSREGQSHSCRPAPTLDSHFEGKPPGLRAAFDKLVKALSREGPLRVDPVATNVHLVAGSAFGSAKPQKAKMRVEFLHDKPIASPRIVKTERLSGTRYALHVDVTGPADVDAELIGWMRAAYRLRA